MLEDGLANDFVMQHAPAEVISPRHFFESNLFNVRNQNAARMPHVQLTLESKSTGGVFYEGPELRQDDALVFMALLNICRDYRAGKLATFNVAAMTTALIGSYSGQQRQLLKQTIKRLQRATLEFSGFTVQLVQRFEHPKRGGWSVALDKAVVELFRDKKKVVWLDLSLRLRLPEGLTTWLYAYIRSQSFLIPWPIEDLRRRCGSDASPKAFQDMLRVALTRLAGEAVIDTGWSLKDKRVHWRKPPSALDSGRRMGIKAAAPEQRSLQLDKAGP
jgi:hypothetical protein